MNKNNNQTSTLTGVIAVMSTLLVVVIIVLVSAKLLFVPEKSDTIKTGRVTSTASLAVTTTNKQKHTSKTKKKTTKDADDYYASDGENGDYTKQTVISAVYLHPQPNSSSENLLVIPVGAVCKVYRNENGWLYLDYDGQKGYAYYTFFTES